MKQNTKFLLKSFFLVLSFLILLPVYSQGLKNAGSELSKIGGAVGAESSISGIAGTVINTALALVGLIFFALMIYAGYLWMTDRGKEEQAKKAKDIIITSIIGLALVMSAYAITAFVMIKFGVE